MHWIFAILKVIKYVGPALLLWATFYQYKIQYISSKTQHHKRTSKRIFLILFLAGVLGLAANIWDDYNRSKKEKDEETYRSQQTSRETNFITQIDRLESQQKINSDEYSRILMALAMNPNPNPALLSELAQAKEHFESIDKDALDLKTWVLELQNKRDLTELRTEQARLKTVEEEKTYITPYFPIWDYTVRTFLTRLDDLAKQLNGKLSSDFTGLPTVDILCPGYTSETGWGDISFRVTDASIGTNIAWNCKLYIVRKARMVQCSAFSQPTLTIECVGKSGTKILQISNSQTTLNDPGKLPIIEQLSASDYKKSIDMAVRELIAAEAGDF